MAWSSSQKRLYVANYIGSSISVIRDDSSDIHEEFNGTGSIPQNLTLLQNYPNPFNASTVISYALSKPNRVKLDVFNILGQLVCTLVDDHQSAGHKSEQWDGRDDHGQQIASGVYLYRISAGEFTMTRRMVLLR